MRAVAQKVANGGGVCNGPAELARLFTGVLRSDVTCLKCRNKSTKLEEFHDVSIDLSKRTPTASQPATPAAGGPPAGGGFGGGAVPTNGGEAEEEAMSYHESLAACLHAFTKSERLSFSERCWCNHCGALQESAKQLSFHRLPSVLCFHLKRFRHSASSKQPSTKVDEFVEFPLHSLNMRPHTAAHVAAAGAGVSGGPPPLEPLPEELYDLFGVAIHHGTISNGHYTAYVQSHAEWFHCDDALVSTPPHAHPQAPRHAHRTTSRTSRPGPRPPAAMPCG
jgi:ubiquitin carboxyl-terminal hydrolase 22/27/51